MCSVKWLLCLNRVVTMAYGDMKNVREDMGPYLIVLRNAEWALRRGTLLWCVVVVALTSYCVYIWIAGGKERIDECLWAGRSYAFDRHGKGSSVGGYTQMVTVSLKSNIIDHVRTLNTGNTNWFLLKRKPRDAEAMQRQTSIPSGRFLSSTWCPSLRCAYSTICAVLITCSNIRNLVRTDKSKQGRHSNGNWHRASRRGYQVVYMTCNTLSGCLLLSRPSSKMAEEWQSRCRVRTLRVMSSSLWQRLTSQFLVELMLGWWSPFCLLNKS